LVLKKIILSNSYLFLTFLGLATPTFNLTSSKTRTRRSTGKKINVDIRNAIYKLPFEHGK